VIAIPTSRFTTIRELGPPKTAPRTTTAIDTVVAIIRRRSRWIRATNQPTSAAQGRTSTAEPNTNHSSRVGRPLIALDRRPPGVVA
jgi:hypothetical protein